MLIQWSLKNRRSVVALAAAFLVGGGYVASRVPVDVLPDLTAPTVTVLVEGHGMTPTDMESLVTFPIEAVLNGASGVRRVRSATTIGIAVVWIDFDWGEDIYRARQIVTEKLAAVARTLPAEIDPPVLAPLSSIMGEIMFIALESDTHTPLELRTTADTIVRRRLLATPGVSQVTVIGGERKQFEVLVDPERLANYGVSLERCRGRAKRCKSKHLSRIQISGWARVPHSRHRTSARSRLHWRNSYRFSQHTTDLHQGYRRSQTWRVT